MGMNQYSPIPFAVPIPNQPYNNKESEKLLK